MGDIQGYIRRCRGTLGVTSFGQEILEIGEHDRIRTDAQFHEVNNCG